MADTREAQAPSGDSERRLDLDAAIAVLPRMQRAVIVMRFYDDRTVAEIAEALALPRGTVSSHLSRALAALRRSDLLKDTP